MTNQDSQYQSNQGHQGVPEGAVQPPTTKQGSEKPVPNTGLLTFVFFLNIGYLGLFIGSALMVGGWAIAFLFFLGLHLISYITVSYTHLTLPTKA